MRPAFPDRSAMPAEAEAVIDIRECDREPIHIPGAIQPHGLLLVVSPEDGRIRAAAGPFARLIDFPEDPVGRTLWDVIGVDLETLTEDHPLGGVTEPVFVGALPGPQGELDILAHGRDGNVLLEIEPALADRPSAARLFARMREAADGMRGCASHAEAFAAAAAEIRAATGFDRVLVYRFLGDGSGEVVGEARSGAFDPLLGHRFPAGDVPQQARALYLRNLIRVIPDAGYLPAPLRGLAEPLDMSDCGLRSVSQVHLRYLENMGVAASMSVSLVRDGALWGLIACHHSAPRLVPYETREACKHVAAELMRRLQSLDAAAEAATARRLMRDIDHLTARIAQRPDVAAGLAELLPALAESFGADGLVLRAQHGLPAAGPLADALDGRRLLDALERIYGAGVFATDDIEGQDPDGDWRQELEGGLMFVATGGVDGIAFALLRRRIPEHVIWAGDPRKTLERDARTGKLGPRRSFAIWQEVQRGLARPWTPAEIEAAERLAGQIERLVRQQRISVLQSELIHVSRVSAMGALASTLAHELNQPLTAIANFSRGIGHLLRAKDGGVDEAIGYLDQMSHAAVRAGQVVKRLRAMVGKAPVQKDQVFVEQVIADALSLALPDAHVRGITVAVEIAPGAETVIGDTVQIEQVLTNLIRNAGEAMEGARVRQLTLAARPAAPDWVELSVADTGPGLNAAAQATLFAPFSSGKASGMGLGLSICRTIVERHEGRIWIEERDGPGATFRFTLPRGEPALR